ncbi:MAG: ABC transporter ATP-binding protein/permease [Oscillospiraceae bacterium]|jgi:ATP-binding cassette subfamily B protein|nr:ABC transporter ATP-binding protein/permease [Oscillospiraceae bacterium]
MRQGGALSLKKLMAYIKPYSLRIFFGMFIKFAGTIMDLLIPWILAFMIDNIVPRNSIPSIIRWGLLMLLCSVIAVAGNIIANRMASSVARDVTQEIRYDLFSRISYLSSAQIDEMSIPSLVSRLTSDTYNVHRMVTMMQRLGIRAPILLLGGILITLTLDPFLTLVLIAVLPFITIVIFSISRKGIPLYTQVQESVDRMVRVVRENAAGIRVIKALSKTDYEKGRFKGVNTELRDRELKAGVTMALSNPLMTLLLNIGLTFVIIAGAYRVNGGMAQPGVILAFLTYFTIILNAMMAITRMFVLLSKGTASANRISDVLEKPEDLKLMDMHSEESGFHVVFDHVSFSYNKGKAGVNDISFALKRGETLGIIGATGCGKSTVIQLLMRLYDVRKGRILIDGEDIRAIPPERLHTMFGIAFQNDVLFADTITENIDFGRRLEKQQIEDAAAFAQADEFVNSVENGYEHLLTSRGTNLSGGQKQRLLIARALAANPEILILDDSSSALDYRTDAELRKALGRNFAGTTTIVVAQRISSIMHADHIMVLEEGVILGYGTHEALMEGCEIYREISESQMGEKLA